MYGESYEATALRELSEELGLPLATLAAAGLRSKAVFRWTDEWCDVWACAFRTVLPPEACSGMHLQEEEVAAAAFVPLPEVRPELAASSAELMRVLLVLANQHADAACCVHALRGVGLHGVHDV